MTLIGRFWATPEAAHLEHHLREGNLQKKVRPLADLTIDKIRRIMTLVYKYEHPQPFQ